MKLKLSKSIIIEEVEEVEEEEEVVEVEGEEMTGESSLLTD